MKTLSELKLIEQAYLARYNSKEKANEYQAAAVDNDGNNYLVIWIESEDYNPTDNDESTACDWKNPYKIIKN